MGGQRIAARAARRRGGDGRGGAARVYELQQGPADFVDAKVAHWFGKPAGMRYAELFGELAGVPGSLWMRQMVLGPSPEFVLLPPAT